MIGRMTHSRRITAAAALFGLAAIALAITLLPTPSVRDAEAQEQELYDYDCSNYKVCIRKETIPGSTVQFPFILEIEQLHRENVGATDHNETETVFLGDGDELGMQFFGRAWITEVPVEGWELIDIDCEGSSDYGWEITGNTIEIYYAIGGPSSFLDCIFVNRRVERPGGGPAPGLGAGLGGLFAGQPTPLPTARPAAVAPAATAPTTISPPRTGDAGLK